jgi:hypothetical protein
MADFFSNLLLRSNASAKTSAEILQPRLPSLYESIHGADEIPSPQPTEQYSKEITDLLEHGSAVAAHFSENHPEPKQKNNLRVIVPEKDSRMFAAPEAHEKPLPPAQNNLPKALTKIPNQTIIPKYRAGRTSVSDARPPDQPPMRVEWEVTLNAQPTVEAEKTPSTQENGQTPRVEIRSVNVGQSKDRKSAQNRSAEYALHPHVEPVPSQPILKPVLTPQPISVISQGAVAPPQQAQEHESVVEIHIGRIEVRALTPPTPPPAGRATLSKPKMSLDDYLLRREDKR